MDKHDISGLQAAFSTIAAFLEEDGVNKEGEVINTLAFTQQQVLAKMCYAMHNAITYTQTTGLSKAQSDVARAQREWRSGDEIAEGNLAARVDWLERIQYQLAHLEAIFSVVAETYKAKTGRDWTVQRQPSQMAALPAEVAASPAMARSIALLNKAPSLSTQAVTGLRVVNGGGTR